METKEKTVLVDKNNRILAFQPFENGSRITQSSLPCHTFALNGAFQVVLVEPGAGESGVKLFGAFAKAEGCQQQKRERRKQRQHGTQSTQSHADAAQCDVQDFLDVHVVFFNRLFSFLVSIT